MLEGIIEILSWIMKLTHNVSNSWAIDIILLTILVRLALFPLNRIMNKNMKLMGKVQPEMKEVQEKYKGKPEELQKQTMELYRKYKINPLASCWPMMIQMPIFFALFRMLRDPRFYLRLPGFENATIFGINLTVPPQIQHPLPEVALKAGVYDLYSLINNAWLADRFIYVPTLWLLAGYIITTLLQSKMMQSQTQTSQPGQPNTMALMMPMFIFFGLFFPVGLLVYFITSNLLQIFTYWRIQREVAAEGDAGSLAPPIETGSGKPNLMNFFKPANKTGGESGLTKPNKVFEPQGKKKKKKKK